MSTPTKSPMRTCPHCGHLIPSSQSVCIYCGKDETGNTVTPPLINKPQRSDGVDPKILRIVFISFVVILVLITISANIEVIMSAVSSLFTVVIVIGSLFLIGILLQPNHKRPTNKRNPVTSYIDPSDKHRYVGTQSQISACITLRRGLYIKFDAAEIAAKNNEDKISKLRHTLKVVMAIEDCSTLLEIKSMKPDMIAELVDRGTIR